MVYIDEIREWSQQTKGGFERIAVDGDHWFLNRNRALITATIQDIAARYRHEAADHVVRPTITAASGRNRE